jgi:hypothetical protein
MNTFTVKDGVEQNSTKTEKRTMHNVILLDASGSMASRGYGLPFYTTNSTTFSYPRSRPQSKYEAAIQGINQEIQTLRNNKDANVLVSVYEFDSVKPNTERITEHCFCTPVDEVEDTIKGRGPTGNTPLYQSLAYVIEKFLRSASNEDQVVISIFTDGAHNCPWGKYGSEAECKKLIKDVERNRNFTITFVGTQEDAEFVTANLGINLSNTMSYDGTADGLNKALKSRGASLLSYTKSVGAGTATTSNFYSNTDTITDADSNTNVKNENKI